MINIITNNIIKSGITSQIYWKLKKREIQSITVFSTTIISPLNCIYFKNKD